MSTYKPLRPLDPLIDEGELTSLEKSPFLKQLHRLVCHKIEAPFCLSINGTWGSGKTSLMMALQARLTKDGFPTVWFNPWEYERAEDVVLCFLASLCQKTQSKWPLDWSDFKVFSLSFFTSGVDAFARVVSRNAINFKNMADIYSEIEKALGQRDYEDPVALLKEDFEKLTGLIVDKTSHGKYPLVVFLDDLDRCLPDMALEMLEALKNLFVIPRARVIFIAGIDTEVAKRFIVKRYEGMDESYAFNYFRKIFHATVNLPLLSRDEHNALLAARVDELWPSEEPPSGKADVVQRVSKGLEAYNVRSIRKIHHILNGYYLWSSFHGSNASSAEHVIALELLILREKDLDLVQSLGAHLRRQSPGVTFRRFFNELDDAEKKRIKACMGSRWTDQNDVHFQNAQGTVTIDRLRWL
ncbi:AAA family ATPase [Sulfidibacter corallicola]|uniref:AAA family ATPase n=1 Tax=Sulfidibacter corallicola TaxID=2818388 RepID=A0A8A4TLP4_SULCO|nr:P-loop NTPase fold protein [Sulfidibacter corallicola]QTD50909.1 AAA family ATPase [Sulfidibacter corallicola]